MKLRVPKASPNPSVVTSFGLFVGGMIGRWYWYVPLTALDLIDFYRSRLLSVLPSIFAHWSPDMPGEWIGPAAAAGVTIAGILTYHEVRSELVATRVRLARRMRIEFDPARSVEQVKHEGESRSIERTVRLTIRNLCALTIDDVQVALEACYPPSMPVPLPAALKIAHELNVGGQRAERAFTLHPDGTSDVLLATRYTPAVKSDATQPILFWTLPHSGRVGSGRYVIAVRATGRDASLCREHFVLEVDAHDFLQCRIATPAEVAAVGGRSPERTVHHPPPSGRVIRSRYVWGARTRDPWS